MNPNIMENYITVRVFFKITDDSSTLDLTKKLFNISGEESIAQRNALPTQYPINVKSESEIYIDVNTIGLMTDWLYRSRFSSIWTDWISSGGLSAGSTRIWKKPIANTSWMKIASTYTSCSWLKRVESQTTTFLVSCFPHADVVM